MRGINVNKIITSIRKIPFLHLKNITTSPFCVHGYCSCAGDQFGTKITPLNSVLREFIQILKGEI